MAFSPSDLKITRRYSRHEIKILSVKLRVFLGTVRCHRTYISLDVGVRSVTAWFSPPLTQFSTTVFETASQVSGWDWLKRGLKKKGDAARESAVLWLCLTRLSVKVPCSFPLLT